MAFDGYFLKDMATEIPREESITVRTGAVATSGNSTKPSGLPQNAEGAVPGDDADGGMAGSGSGMGPKLAGIQPDIKKAADLAAPPGPPQTAADAKESLEGTRDTASVAVTPGTMADKAHSLGMAEGAPNGVGVDGQSASQEGWRPDLDSQADKIPSNLKERAAATVATAERSENGVPGSMDGVKKLAAGAVAPPKVEGQAVDISTLPGRSRTKEQEGADLAPKFEPSQEQKTVS